MGRCRLRLTIAAAAVLAGLTVAVVLAFPEIVRRVVIWRVAAMTHRPVTLAAADLRLFGGRLALHDLRVIDHDDHPLATIEGLQAQFSPRDLLRGHLRITHAALQAPTLRIVRAGPREFNISDLLAGKAAGTVLAVTLEQVTLRAGAVAIEDRTLAPPRVWRVDALTVDMRDVSSRPEAPPGVVSLSAVAAGSPISVWAGGVRLAPLRFHATVNARGIDGSLAALYLPPHSPLTPARARLDASATIEHDGAAGTRFALDAVFSGVELRRPGERTAYLSAPAVRVTVEDLRVSPGAVELGRLAVDGGRAVLEDARLGPVRRWPAEDIVVEARNLSSVREAPPGVGVVRAVVAGSPVSAWIANLRLAPLELHATAAIRNVDFALFRLYVPPDLPVQPERGVVNASLRIDHDERRGTRVALDAALGGVELRRPAHVLTAPALRVTAEDIAYGGGVVTVGRVAVAGDRLTIEDRTLSPARSWVVKDLAAEASRLSSRREDVQGIATARATVAGASVSAWMTHVRLDPLELRATAILRDLDLALVQLYLPDQVPAHIDSGLVNATLQVDHDAASGTRLTGDMTLTGVQARGRGPADRLAVSAPSLRLVVTDARRHEDSWAARVRVDAALAEGGTVAIEGTVAGEPASADVRVTIADADLGLLQPSLPFRAVLRSRVDATLAVTGPLWPAPRLTAKGDATLRRLALSDGQRQVLTVEQLSATGIDATWPDRLSLDAIRVRRSWALIERDRQGRFLLRTLLERPATPGSTGDAARAPGGRRFELKVAEGIFEEGAATIVDAVTTPPARLEVAGARLAFRDLAWPSRAPVTIEVASPAPGGGRLQMGGTVNLDPFRLDVRLGLEGVELAPAQPYLPIEGRVAGRVTGDLAVTVALDPVSVKVGGEARLQRFRLSDGDRPVVTVGRAEALGIDVDWPTKIALERFLLRRPSLLIERDAQGDFAVRRLVTPRWATANATAPAAPPGTAPRPAPPAIEVGTFSLERASGRFVDHTTAPPYVEQLSRLNVTITGVTTAPDRRLRFTGSGALGGGATLKFLGEAATGDESRLELKADVSDFAVARANPYLDRYTGWTANHGTLSATAAYTVRGTRLDASHDLVVQGLDVQRSEGTDQVEQRLGLPLGFLVSLLKDARGVIRLSVPVSGDLSTREFDFQEAVWGAVRTVAIRLLALPFSRVGSLAFSEDSKVEGVALAPVVFAPGTARLSPAMVGHLDRIAAFLRDAPSVRVRLAPIFTQADLDALGDPLPPDALRDLGTRRLDVVRQGLAERGGIAADRLPGSSRRVPLVEAAGSARVELDLRP